MPSSASSSSNGFYGFLLLILLFVAFFPGLFHYLTALPFSLLFAPSQSSSVPPAVHLPPGCESCATPPSTPAMSWFQKQFTLPPRSRGSFLITDHVTSALPELKDYKVGLLNLFVQHTSCALSLNENWDEDVRADMSDALDRIAPEAGPKGKDLYRHSAEGPDDMPVSSLLSFLLSAEWLQIAS